MKSEKNKQIEFLCLTTVFILFLNLLPANADEIKSYSCQQTAIFASSPKSIDNLAGHFGNKIEIIFSDIDGTLVTFTENTKIPQSVNYSVQKLKQAQIPLVLVSGRSYAEAKNLINNMKNDNIYIVTLQGAEIINSKGKIIYQDNIKNKDFRKILKAVDLFNKLNHQHSKVCFFVKGKTYSKEDFVFTYVSQPVKVIKSINQLGLNVNPGKIMIYEPNIEKLKALKNFLKKNFPNYNINMATDWYCEIVSPTASKGNAVKKIVNILDVNLKNSAAFGDSENDISMLKEVKNNGGLAVAVGNAMNSVKDNAGFITSSVYEDGFAKAVDIILINNASLK